MELVVLGRCYFLNIDAILPVPIKHWGKFGPSNSSHFQKVDLELLQHYLRLK